MGCQYSYNSHVYWLSFISASHLTPDLHKVEPWFTYEASDGSPMVKYIPQETSLSLWPTLSGSGIILSLFESALLVLSVGLYVSALLGSTSESQLLSVLSKSELCFIVAEDDSFSDNILSS